MVREVRVVRFAKGATVSALVWIALLPLLGMKFPAYELLGAITVFGGILAMTPLRGLVWGGAVIFVVWMHLWIYIPGTGSAIRARVRADKPEKVDAVVVLSSSATEDGRISATGLSRLVGGLDLVHQGYAPVLVTTRLPPHHGSTDEDVHSVVSLCGGKAAHEIVGPVYTTRDEARKVKELADARGWKRVIVVTSPTHSRRAAEIFEGVDLQVLSVPSPERSYSLSTLRHPRDRVIGMSSTVYEWLAVVKQRILGRNE
jgi:hypothetical protein